MTRITNGDLYALRRDAQSRAGAGVQMTQELGAELAQVEISFPSFRGGLDYSQAPHNVSTDFTQETRNVVITERGYLKRTPGHMIAETMAARVVRDMHLHPSLDFSAELLLFDAPFIGVKSTGATVWYDAELPTASRWIGVTNGEDFVFSDGNTILWRRPFAGTPGVVAIPDAPAGRTIANFAGRVFLGGFTQLGVYQSLGIYWSGGSGLVTDWTGIGSGAELLISNNATDDRIIAMRPMSFDILAILCQKNIWVGLRTGDPNRPADFQQRTTGIGCIAEPTAQVTPIGVIFLSEGGVYVFDGNNASLLSGTINAALLPIDRSNINRYSATYDTIESRYWLYTPQGTWCFELKHNRWTFLTSVVENSVVFSQQFVALTWEASTGTWANAAGAWEDASPSAGAQAIVMSRGNVLAMYSDSSYSFLDGQSTIARYRLGPRDTPEADSMFTLQRAIIRYRGSTTGMAISYKRPSDGADVSWRLLTLPDRGREYNVAEIGGSQTMIGMDVFVEWNQPTIEICHVKIKGMFRSSERIML